MATKSMPVSEFNRFLGVCAVLDKSNIHAETYLDVGLTKEVTSDWHEDRKHTLIIGDEKAPDDATLFVGGSVEFVFTLPMEEALKVVEFLSTLKLKKGHK